MERTIDGIITFQHLRDAFDAAIESKAEPRPAVAARGQGIGLGEFLEQFCLLFRGQADPGIGDSKLDPVASVLKRLSRICLSLMESALSAPTFSWASTMRRLWVLLGKLSRSTDDLIDKPGQINRLGIEFELAGFDLREVQYLV
jgi:hypothetical protein